MTIKIVPLMKVELMQVSDFLVLELERLQTMSVSLNPACRAYARRNIHAVEVLNQLVDTSESLTEIAYNPYFVIMFGQVNLTRG